MIDPHRVVSSEREELILVDENDKAVGFQSKADCHDGPGIRHRAFSLFLFNAEGELLLQQRSAEKRLWPGYWSNSCCSHPRRGESLLTATERRLDDELNIAAELQHIYHFCYDARYDEAGSENELCHVYLGRVVGAVKANRREISAVRFVSREKVDQELLQGETLFTPWFRQEWNRLNDEFSAELDDYAI